MNGQTPYADELRKHYAKVRARLDPPKVCRRIPVLTIEEIPIEIDETFLPLPPLQHWKRIALEVASKHGLTMETLIGRRGRIKYTVARGEAMTRIRNEVRYRDGRPPSVATIGQWFDGRDHTSVLNAMKKYAATQT